MDSTAGNYIIGVYGRMNSTYSISVSSEDDQIVTLQGQGNA
jgi:hypothetical protein